MNKEWKPVELSIWLLSVLLFLSLASLGVVIWKLMNLLTTSQQSLSQMAQIDLLREQEQTARARLQSNLVDKAMALVGTADPLSFQQVQAMGTPSGYDDSEPFDPSDEAELERITKRRPDLGGGDEVSGYEEAFLSDLGDAGLDREFFDIPDPDGATRPR